MSAIEAIQAVNTSEVSKLVATNMPSISNVASNSFVDQLSSINNQLQAADVSLQNAALGKNFEMHEVLIQMEQTKVSFELMVETRNKLLEAYQELMRMQI